MVKFIQTKNIKRAWSSLPWKW